MEQIPNTLKSRRKTNEVGKLKKNNFQFSAFNFQLLLTLPLFCTSVNVKAVDEVTDRTSTTNNPDITANVTPISANVMSESNIVTFDAKPAPLKAFEIWNWEDLAHVVYVQENYPEATFKVMQHIGTPGGVFLDENGDPTTIPNYGDGSTMTTSRSKDHHPGDKRFGWYGYEGFIGNDNSTPYEDYSGTADILKGLDEAGATTYETYAALSAGDKNDDCGWIMTTGKGWITIGKYVDGTDGKPFYGAFDGQGFAVSGLWIDRSTDTHQGLFGYVKGSAGNPAKIENLGVNLSGSGIIGNNYAGGLAGHIEYSEITNCYVNGDVTGINDYAGGLVGAAETGSSITNCYATGAVTGTGGTHVGGLVGYAYGNTTITHSFAFNPQIASETNSIGHIVGYGNTITLVSNYALKTIEVTIDGTVISIADETFGNQNDADIPACVAIDKNVNTFIQRSWNNFNPSCKCPLTPIIKDVKYKSLLK